MSKNSVSIAARDSELEEALAVLISSTRSKHRPLPLTNIAERLRLAVAKLGSHSAVGERIGVSGKMLKQFASVERLTPKVKALFRDRAIDSVDAAAHLAMLPHVEQELVARALATGTINTSDVRAVVQLRRIRPRSSITNIIKRVRESKTQQHYIAEFVIREIDDPRMLRAIFGKHINPAEIIRVDLDGSFGRLVVTARGKRQLTDTSRELAVPLRNVVQKIISKGS